MVDDNHGHANLTVHDINPLISTAHWLKWLTVHKWDTQPLLIKQTFHKILPTVKDESKRDLQVNCKIKLNQTPSA